MSDWQRRDTSIVAVQMELTNACPLSTCVECAYRFMSRPIGHMDFNLAKAIVDGAVSAFGTTVNFNLNGLGEPISYLKLPDLILYIGAKAPNGRIELFSSLVGSKDRVEEICRALDKVSNNVLFAVTCHIRDDKGHILDQTVSHFQFETVYRMLKSNPRIDLHVATNKSIYTETGDVRVFRNIFEDMLPPEKVHVIEELDSWLETIRPVAISCSDVESKSVCDYPFNVLHVAWDGTCLICCTDDVNGELPVGKIEKEEDVKTVWFSEKMEEIRNRHNNLDVCGLSPCNRCGRTVGYVTR